MDIEDVKVDIRQKLLSFSGKVLAKTVNHALNIFLKCGKDVCFGSKNQDREYSTLVLVWFYEVRSGYSTPHFLMQIRDTFVIMNNMDCG